MRCKSSYHPFFTHESFSTDSNTDSDQSLSSNLRSRTSDLGPQIQARQDSNENATREYGIECNSSGPRRSFEEKRRGGRRLDSRGMKNYKLHLLIAITINSLRFLDLRGQSPILLPAPLLLYSSSTALSVVVARYFLRLRLRL